MGDFELPLFSYVYVLNLLAMPKSGSGKLTCPSRDNKVNLFEGKKHDLQNKRKLHTSVVFATPAPMLIASKIESEIRRLRERIENSAPLHWG